MSTTAYDDQFAPDESEPAQPAASSQSRACAAQRPVAARAHDLNDPEVLRSHLGNMTEREIALVQATVQLAQTPRS
jgi:hypothetical protein